MPGPAASGSPGVTIGEPMPLYEFRCESCGETFEEIVAAGATTPCPACGSDRTERRFSAPGIAGRRLQVTGSGAKDAEARRREREGARGERLADAKKARARGESPRGSRERKLPPGFWA